MSCTSLSHLSSSLSPSPSPFPDVSSHWRSLLSEEKKLAAKWKRKAKDLKRKLDKSKSPDQRLESVKAECKRLRKKLRSALLRSAEVDGKVAMKDEDGRYPLHVKYASLKMLALGIPDSKQADVMRIVSEMIGVKLSHVPSESTVRSWSSALAVLNRMHTAHVLSSAPDGLCLMRDETTKKGEKMQQHAVSLPDGTVHHLGITEVWDKSALVSLQVLQDKICSLSRYSPGSSHSASLTFNNFVLKIKNLMSDRASTETLFNKLFQQTREAVLEVQEGWEDLSDQEKEDSVTLCEHFCSLHAVANLYSVVAKELAAHEGDSSGAVVADCNAGFYVLIKEVCPQLLHYYRNILF